VKSAKRLPVSQKENTHLMRNQERSQPIDGSSGLVNGWVLWSFVSPLILFFQALPEKETTTRIREGTV